MRAMSWNVFVYDWAHAPGSTFDLLFLPWLILAIPGFVWMVHAAYPAVGLAVAALRVPYFVTIAIFYDFSIDDPRSMAVDSGGLGILAVELILWGRALAGVISLVTIFARHRAVASWMSWARRVGTA